MECKSSCKEEVLTSEVNTPQSQCSVAAKASKTTDKRPETLTTDTNVLTTQAPKSITVSVPTQTTSATLQPSKIDELKLLKQQLADKNRKCKILAKKVNELEEDGHLAAKRHQVVSDNFFKVRPGFEGLLVAFLSHKRRRVLQCLLLFLVARQSCKLSKVREAFQRVLPIDDMASKCGNKLFPKHRQQLTEKARHFATATMHFLFRDSETGHFYLFYRFDSDKSRDQASKPVF